MSCGACRELGVLCGIHTAFPTTQLGRAADKPVAVLPLCVLCNQPIRPGGSDPASHVGCCMADLDECCLGPLTVAAEALVGDWDNVTKRRALADIFLPATDGHIRGCPMFTHKSQRDPNREYACECKR